MSGGANCRRCRRPIRFVPTEFGKSMPIDPEPVALGNVVLRGPAGLPQIAHVLAHDEQPIDGEPRYRHHTVSCPRPE